MPVCLNTGARSGYVPNFPANALVNLSKSQNTPCLTVATYKCVGGKNNMNPL